MSLQQNEHRPNHASAQTLSADPNMAMQEMMNTIDTLRSIYVRETDALTDADTQAFLELQDEKLEAARTYQLRAEELLKRTDELKTINPMLKEKLEVMQSEFSSLADQNMAALKRMNLCVEHLGNTMRNAAKEEAKKQRTVNYTATGTIEEAERKRVSTGSVSETA